MNGGGPRAGGREAIFCAAYAVPSRYCYLAAWRLICRVLDPSWAYFARTP